MEINNDISIKIIYSSELFTEETIINIKDMFIKALEYVNNNKEFVVNDLKEYLLIDKTSDNNGINDTDVLLDFDF